MGGLAEAARQICDDCDRKVGEENLDWFGRHIRICAPCRALRLANNGQRLSPTKDPTADDQ